VVDHVYLVDKLDLSSDRMRFSKRLVGTGGMMGTALAQAASLGGSAHALSLLGDDVDGQFVRRSLTALGVKTQLLLLSPDFETTVAVVLVEGKTGERRFIVPDRRALESEAPDFDLTLIDRDATLMVDGHFPHQALRAVRRAREVGASVIGDFHRPSPGVRELLPYVDYPIVPREFAGLFSAGGPQRAVEKLADEYGGTPIVTMGEEGGLYLDQGRVCQYAARRVRAIDTTGAGDVFHGAFAVGLARGLGLVESIDLAVRAASLCCTALGGTGRLMTPQDETE
jgi:sugar/nucleoside kinase (ribokinase family)